MGTGRDHNSADSTIGMAGRGIKGGVSIGQTDDLGSAAMERPLKVKHLHATILGFDSWLKKRCSSKTRKQELSPHRDL
jgi:hypothetical protein